MENLGKKGDSYEFGPFRVDASQRLLFCEGRPVPLAPKVVETLLALVERGGELVTKDELMQKLWPDSFVEESNLTQNVFLLRKALGEGGSGAKYIETIPRRGYRFAGEVRHSHAAYGEELIFTSRTRTHILSEEETTDASEDDAGAPHAAVRTTRRDVIEVNPRAWSESSAAAIAPLSPAATRKRAPVLIALAALASLLVAGGFGLSRILNPGGRREPSHDSGKTAVRGNAAPVLEFKRLTYDSKAFYPVLSPDGANVAYMFRDGERESVRLRNIANGSTLQILPPTAGAYANLAFSPDGNYLYFMMLFKGGVKSSVNNVIARVPVFGGTPPQELVREIWSSYALSPDGRQVAFFRGYDTGQEIRLIIADLDSGAERELIKSRHSDLWFNIWSSGPAWSPDGKKIIALAGSKRPAGDSNYLLEVQVGDGSATEVPGAQWRSVEQAAWIPDGTGLVVSAQERQDAPYQLWLVAYPSGEMRRLTNDLVDYDKISVSADSRRLVAQQVNNVTHVWVARGGDAARQLTSGTSDSDGRNGLAWTPDGQILFASTRNGTYDIWVMKVDGTGERQLTADTGGGNWRPRPTPDGRYIVFTSTRAGRQNIWRMDVDGSNPARLTSGEREGTPYVSPDGRWVYYTNYEAKPAAIERVPIEGGAATVISGAYSATDPVISPDGRFVAYEHYDDANGFRTAVIPAEGGGPPRVFDFHAFRGGVRWMPDSQSLVYIDDKYPGKLWRQQFAGGQPRLFASDAEELAYFDLSPDGRELALARGKPYSDLVLLTNFH